MPARSPSCSSSACRAAGSARSTGRKVSVKNYYMACLDLEGRRCLVVGGGTVGLEKALGLLACDARVTVVSPELHDDLRRPDVEWRPRRYRRRDLKGAFLVIAATSER